jgi:hypothetical protein
VRRLGALALIALAATACGSDEGAPPPPDLTGVITHVEGEGSDIESFTVESGLGEWELLIVDGRDYGFDLAHLREHEASGDPVRCTIEVRDGEPFALEIEDALPQ